MTAGGGNDPNWSDLRIAIVVYGIASVALILFMTWPRK